MKLCDHCGHPAALHAGYDHAANKCLLMRDGLDLRIFHGEDRGRALAREVRAWLDEQEARREMGSGI